MNSKCTQQTRACTPVNASDWYALQEALYKCIDTIQCNTLGRQYTYYFSACIHCFCQTVQFLCKDFQLWCLYTIFPVVAGPSEPQSCG